MLEKLSDFGCVGEGERIVSYLPLSHIAAQLIDIHALMGGAAQSYRPKIGALYFARPDAMRGSLVTTLIQVKPTIFFGVPRVWEKIAEGMKAVREKTPKPVLAVTDWAKSHCFERVVNCQLGKSGEAS